MPGAMVIAPAFKTSPSGEIISDADGPSQRWRCSGFRHAGGHPRTAVSAAVVVPIWPIDSMRCIMHQGGHARTQLLIARRQR